MQSTLVGSDNLARHFLLAVTAAAAVGATECSLIDTTCKGNDITCNPFLALLHPRNTLNSYRFAYSGADLAGSALSCASGDQATGVGPFNFGVNGPFGDDVLITVNVPFQMAFQAVACDGNNNSQMRFYLDGVRQQTFGYNRCWGQLASFTSAFVVPGMAFGGHTMELRFCGNGTDFPGINGAYSTILTATSLATSTYYEGRASAALPIGTTTLAASGPFTPIVNGSNMSATYTSRQDVLLWQNLSLGGLQGTGTNLRLDPLTSEDWTMADDGPAPASLYTFTAQAAGTPATITGYYGSGAGNSTISLSPYDSTLNLLAFRTPTAGSYGKAVVSVAANEAAGTLTPLTSVAITNTKDARYLITFAVNYAYNSNAGGGCDFLLFLGGAQAASTPLISSNGTQTLEASLITIETIAAGTVPVDIRFKRAIGGTCTVNRATLTVIPLE